MESKAMIAIHARDPGNRRHLGFVRRSSTLCTLQAFEKKTFDFSKWKNERIKNN